jgi:hypothetical protein
MGAQINKANRLNSKDADPELQHREAWNHSQGVRARTVDVDQAIRAWGEHTDDPYEKGLAALYQELSAGQPFLNEWRVTCEKERCS